MDRNEFFRRGREVENRLRVTKRAPKVKTGVYAAEKNNAGENIAWIVPANERRIADFENGLVLQLRRVTIVASAESWLHHVNHTSSYGGGSQVMTARGIVAEVLKDGEQFQICSSCPVKIKCKMENLWTDEPQVCISRDKGNLTRIVEGMEDTVHPDWADKEVRVVDLRTMGGGYNFELALYDVNYLSFEWERVSDKIKDERFYNVGWP